MDTDYCNGSCTWTWQPNIKWARRHYYFKYVPLELIQWVCRVRGLGYGSRVLEYDLMCTTVDRVFDTGVNMDCGLEACITLACCLHLYPVLCSRPGRNLPGGIILHRTATNLSQSDWGASHAQFTALAKFTPCMIPTTAPCYCHRRGCRRSQPSIQISCLGQTSERDQDQQA